MSVRRFKVKALSVGALNNKIFKSGEEVTSKHFPKDNINKLILDGFIEEIEPTEEDLKENAEGEEASEKKDETPLPPVVEIKAIEDISEEDLKKYLTDNKISFRKKAEKLELYGLYLKSVKAE